MTAGGEGLGMTGENSLPRRAVTAGVGDDEPRRLQLEERREHGRRGKVESLAELVRGERLLAQQTLVDSTGLGRQLRGDPLPFDPPDRSAHRGEELGENVLRSATEDRAVPEELVRPDRRLREYASGNREDVAPAVDRESGGDEGTAPPRSLDDDDARG